MIVFADKVVFLPDSRSLLIVLSVIFIWVLVLRLSLDQFLGLLELQDGYILLCSQLGLTLIYLGDEKSTSLIILRPCLRISILGRTIIRFELCPTILILQQSFFGGDLLYFLRNLIWFLKMTIFTFLLYAVLLIFFNPSYFVMLMAVWTLALALVHLMIITGEAYLVFAVAWIEIFLLL